MWFLLWFLNLSLIEVFIREERFLFNYFRLLFYNFLCHVRISLSSFPFLLKLNYLFLLPNMLLISGLTLHISFPHNLLGYRLNLRSHKLIRDRTLPQRFSEFLTAVFRLIKHFEIGLVYILYECWSNLLWVDKEPLSLRQHLIKLTQAKFFVFAPLTQWKEYLVPGCEREFI